MKLASPPLETRSARPWRRRGPAAAPRIVHAGALHHVGTFEGWGFFLSLLLWATRANRR